MVRRAFTFTKHLLKFVDEWLYVKFRTQLKTDLEIPSDVIHDALLKWCFRKLHEKPMEGTLVALELYAYLLEEGMVEQASD